VGAARRGGGRAPEPYVVPLALAALLLGHLRRRAVPGTGSFAAYGAGLSALLLPSLVAALAGGPLWRPLVLAGVALVVVLLGARGRLQAPLLIGGRVLAADALRLLGPYAAALPAGWCSPSRAPCCSASARPTSSGGRAGRPPVEVRGAGLIPGGY
jgi:hypothetical protein